MYKVITNHQIDYQTLTESCFQKHTYIHTYKKTYKKSKNIQKSKKHTYIQKKHTPLQYGLLR